MRLLKTTALLATLALAGSTAGCYVRGGPGLLAAMAGTAIVTAAIVSSAQPPPPPRVVYVPAPRRGYVWQSGYWMRDRHRWVWVEGAWVSESPGYAWVPTHWERAPDGSWQLIRGYWACAGAEPCS